MARGYEVQTELHFFRGVEHFDEGLLEYMSPGIVEALMTVFFVDADGATCVVARHWLVFDCIDEARRAAGQLEGVAEYTELLTFGQQCGATGG